MSLLEEPSITVVADMLREAISCYGGIGVRLELHDVQNWPPPLRRRCCGLKNRSYMHNSYATLSLGIVWNNPRVTCIFLVYTRAIIGERVYQGNTCEK